MINSNKLYNNEFKYSLSLSMLSHVHTYQVQTHCMHIKCQVISNNCRYLSFKSNCIPCLRTCTCVTQYAAYMHIAQHTHTRIHTHNDSFLYILITFYITVPPPTVSVTAPNNQTVGQSLILQCEVTTVRGITSRVDIVWRNSSTEIQRTNVSSTMTNNSLAYRNSYTISQLSTDDQDSVYWCWAEINSIPVVADNDSIALNVTGKQTTDVTLCMGASKGIFVLKM